MMLIKNEQFHTIKKKHDLKDTHREKALTNKTPTLSKSRNIDI